MVQVIFNSNESQTTVYGLTQGDYGQVLYITGINLLGKSIQAQFTSESYPQAIRMLVTVDEAMVVTTEVPNILLRHSDNIICYLYVTDEISGETIYTIYLPVKSKKLPEDFIPPEQKDIINQIITKLNSKADNISFDSQTGYLQLMSEATAIGDRIRITVSSEGGGREIELRNNGEEIQWRYTDSNEWFTLVPLNDLKGEPGETPRFELRDGHLFAIYQSDNLF